jgi:hypothetical protein
MPVVYAADLAAFLDKPGDAALIALAEKHLPIVGAMVKAHTRGNGFDVTGYPNAELAAVITTATARLLANPEQLSYDIGGVSMRGGFNGFNLAELAVLNRYRVRAQ